MHAKDIMTTQLITVGPNVTVREIARLLAEKGISAVPVV
ncbi:CBS domain-containing protein, partial [candidate division KSB1 bacterium]|nr:CBS domain-containing protein [Phycisphaerae bacterium]NIV96976.1 CBS domain-containing protein [candidate division KSB1 bacterium]